MRLDVRRVHSNDSESCQDMTEAMLVRGALAKVNFNLRFVVEGAFQKMFQNRNGGINARTNIFPIDPMWALRSEVVPPTFAALCSLAGRFSELVRSGSGSLDPSTVWS